MKIDLRSEIGELEGVILHTPGPEVENMTPQNAERALYSDILNLSVARVEYAQLADLLDTVTKTFQVRDLLESILAQPAVRAPLILHICEAEGCLDLCDELLALPEKELARQLIDALRNLGMELKPVSCGGKKDLWTQEREQWHSGANFFALAPGKVVGYARNDHTMEEMNLAGFEVIRADDIISGRIRLDDVNRCAVTLDGSELPRGGGGARCMTMPIRRKPVEW